MKKLITCLTVLALAVGTACMTVSAHGGHHNSQNKRQSSKIVYHCAEDCTYADNDGDGICDSCGNRGYYCKKDCSYIDEDGDGICDNCDTKGICSRSDYFCKNGCAYADNDGDGICDNCGNYGYRCKKDCSYIDKDGDGICDNCDTKGVCSYKPKARSKRCHH